MHPFYSEKIDGTRQKIHIQPVTSLGFESSPAGGQHVKPMMDLLLCSGEGNTMHGHGDVPSSHPHGFWAITFDKDNSLWILSWHSDMIVLFKISRF